MQHGFLIVRLHQARIHLDLMSQSHAPLVVDQPDRTTRGGQRRNDSLQNCWIILSGLRVRLRKFRDLVDQGPNVTFGIFYILIRWSGSHSW